MDSEHSVYLDYNATTPLHPAVRAALIDAFDLYANASSMHSAGRKAFDLVEKARSDVAGLLGTSPGTIVFTGGGSESNNSVLKLVEAGSQSGRRGIVTTAVEHPSVLGTVEYLGKRGVPITYIGVDETGTVLPDELEKAVTDRTALVSVMLANNEIGTIQDLRSIARIAHEHGALVHTDAVQAVGKIAVDVGELDVDYLSFSGHKLCGPKGVGVLYVREGVPFTPLIHGGHQEDGRRAGTTNSTGIIGLGAAVRVASEEMAETSSGIASLRDRLKQAIEETIPDIVVNGHPENMLPGTLNVSFRGAEGESILLYLDLEGISVSTGSACASGSLEPSHVLLATGIGPELAHGSIRFSLGHFTTAEEIDYVAEKLPPVINRIRSMSTTWSGHASSGHTSDGDDE